MSNITIDQLEPDLRQRLEQRAVQHGRTIAQADATANEAEIKSMTSPEI